MPPIKNAAIAARISIPLACASADTSVAVLRGIVSAIFGVISPNGGEPPDRALLQMRSALAAHGGDGSATWAGRGTGLGQELKRITPEDLAERQPLLSRDGQRVLVSDGRIDNRRELSAELGLAWESPQ